MKGRVMYIPKISKEVHLNTVKRNLESGKQLLFIQKESGSVAKSSIIKGGCEYATND